MSGGKAWCQEKKNLSPEKRKIGEIFARGETQRPVKGRKKKGRSRLAGKNECLSEGTTRRGAGPAEDEGERVVFLRGLAYRGAGADQHRRSRCGERSALEGPPRLNDA